MSTIWFFFFSSSVKREVLVKMCKKIQRWVRWDHSQDSQTGAASTVKFKDLVLSSTLRHNRKYFCKYVLIILAQSLVCGVTDIDRPDDDIYSKVQQNEFINTHFSLWLAANLSLLEVSELT